MREDDDDDEKEDTEEEAVFARESITSEDPPNAHQAQHRPKPRLDKCVASVHPFLLYSGAVVLALITLVTLSTHVSHFQGQGTSREMQCRRKPSI